MNTNNKSIIRNTFISLIFAIIFCFTGFSQTLNYYDFNDLMDFTFIPENPNSENKYFATNGSLFGFSLPDKSKENHLGSFLGPYSITEQKWISESLVNFSLSDGNLIPFSTAKESIISQYPGMLYQKYIFDSFYTEHKLIMLSGRSALIQLLVVNSSDKVLSFALRADGTPFDDIGIGSKFANGWRLEIIDTQDLFYLIRFKADRDLAFGFSDDYYEFGDKSLIELQPKDTMSLTMTISQYFVRDPLLDTELISSAVNQPELYFQRNINLWNYYLSRFPLHTDIKLTKLAVKSLQTLFLNLRSPSKNMGNYYILSDNYSDYEYYNTDESWLYSASLFNFDPALAKQHYLAVMNFQNRNGSLPKIVKPLDFRTIDSDKHNNYPLAAWTAWNIFAVNPDGEFILQALPILEKYHQFWYNNYDTNNNGWIETIDGFECPVTNALLYTEKYALEKISETLHEQEKKAEYQLGREMIRKSFNEYFFDSDLNKYVMINPINGKQKVSQYGGVFALWAGLATAEIAKLIADELRINNIESIEFWKNEFDPYYVYFAISGLKHYGFNELANAFKERMINVILKDGIESPLFNLYNSDEKVIPNSAKTAAVLLLLLGV